MTENELEPQEIPLKLNLIGMRNQTPLQTPNKIEQIQNSSKIKPLTSEPIFLFSLSRQHDAETLNSPIQYQMELHPGYRPQNLTSPMWSSVSD